MADECCGGEAAPTPVLQAASPISKSSAPLRAQSSGSPCLHLGLGPLGQGTAH